MAHNIYERNLTVSTLFSRFIVGFGSGFLGMIVLSIIIFVTWGVVGDMLSAQNDIDMEGLVAQGVIVTSDSVHPLFLLIITFSIFLSTMVANMAYTFLSISMQEEFSRKSTALTHVFFGNLFMLLICLPIYIVSSASFGLQGISVAALFHGVLTMFFTAFVLQMLHEEKHIMVNLYGNLFGLALFFLFVSLFQGMDKMILILMSFPFFMGTMAFGNRSVELAYGWIYKNYGTDFLNSDTRFGDDYGVKNEVVEEFDI